MINPNCALKLHIKLKDTMRKKKKSFDPQPFFPYSYCVLIF